MAAFDGYFGLVTPLSAELARRPGQDRTGLGIDEQLRDLVLRDPLGIGVDKRRDIRRLAVDRDLARPGQGRTAVVARPERPAVFLHFGRVLSSAGRARPHA